MARLGRLKGRVALVTGGASGIGTAVVRHFLDEGARVAFTDLHADGGTALSRELGEDVLFMCGDHADEANNRLVVQRTLDTFGALDILHDNAGTIIQGNIDDTDGSAIENLLRVNLLGPFLMVKAALPALRRRAMDRQCAILFTASVQSLIVRSGYTAYGASKHGLAGLTRSPALELAASNIRVNAICPGPVETALFRAGTSHLALESADLAARTRPGVPMGRFIELREVAEAACFLVSDQASAITGALLPVDGGIAAR